MNKLPFRDEAKNHVEVAKQHLSKNDPPHIRAACLEIRMAIECISYDLLQTYFSEAPNSALLKWQPKKVIDELLYIDPAADKTVTIAIGIEETYGEPSQDMKFLGTDKKLTVQFVHKSYNTIGNFLHTPTIQQYASGKAKSSSDIVDILIPIIEKIEESLSSNLFNTNFGRFADINCLCGFKIRRKVEFLENKKDLICANCSAQYDYEYNNDTRELKYRIGTTNFSCESCDEKHVWPTHKLKAGAKFRCKQCGYQAQLVQGLAFAPMEAPQHPSTSSQPSAS